MKVLVSLDEQLVRRIDRRAQELGMTRSGFVAQVAREHLERGSGTRVDPARARSVARARAACAAAAQTDDATSLVRHMRDER